MERVGTAYLGILLWVASVAIYAGNGFSTAVGLLWVLGLVLGGAAPSEPIELPARIDLIVPPLLMLAFAPLDLVRIASLPVQVNSDEVAFSYYAKQYASAAHPDLFGLSAYFGHPVVLAVGAWNGFIGWDFIHKGQSFGDDIGGTGRFVQAHSGIRDERFYISSDQRLLSYHTWGTPDIWTQRLQLFARNEGQIGGVIDPTRLPRFSAQPPFVIFMRGELWNRVKNHFERRYGHVGAHQITPDGLHLAVGVRRA